MLEVSDREILAGSFKVKAEDRLYWKVTLAGERNWSLNTSPAEAVPAGRRQWLARQFREREASSSAVRDLFPHTAQETRLETHLADLADCATVAGWWLELWGARRRRVCLDLKMQGLVPGLGQVIRITSRAPGFTGGALALIQHNLSYDGVITLQAGSAPGTSDLMDQAYPAWEPLFGLGEGGLGQYGLGGYLTPEQVQTFFPAGTLRIIYFDEVRARYWRLLLEDADNPNGYLQAGRVILDFYRQSSRMVASGMKITAQDPSKVSYSKGGQAWRDARTKYRTGTYRYQYIPENQTYGLFFAMLQELGVGVSFVADFFHGDSQVSRRLHNQLYCHIPAGALPPLENLTPNYGHVTLTVRESR